MSICFAENLGDFHMFESSIMMWTELTAKVGGSVPSARWGHGLASVESELYLFGGCDGIGNPCPIPCDFLVMHFQWILAEADKTTTSAVAFGDFYVYSAMTWSNITSEVKGAIPSPRESHGFTSAGGKIYLYGGASWSLGMQLPAPLLCAKAK